jgi:L-ornithine N5-monooxygenase
MSHIYDVIGVGYGPANMALAIAMDERQEAIDAVFVEAADRPRWQGEMLLPGSDIQHNAIRDLVSLRNPRSRYSFINYLHENDRLLGHLNLPRPFALRSEYADYIDWVRRTLPATVTYGRPVKGISPSPLDPACWDVTLQGGGTLTARCISLGPGRSPYIPSAFAGLDEQRVFHLTSYLSRIQDLAGRFVAGLAPRIVVVGGSQSAVEITLDLAGRFPDATISVLARPWALRAKDHSPFSEEIYSPDFTQYYYRSDEAHRRRLDVFTRPTNYSAADLDVLENLYMRIYEEKILGRERIKLRGEIEIVKAEEDGAQIRLTIRSAADSAEDSLCADAVVLATGFRDMGPEEHQEPWHPLLDSVAPSFVMASGGYLAVAKDYALVPLSENFGPVYLNGLCETTHGIGDAGSFSLLSIRAQTIMTSIEEYLHSLKAGGRRGS